MKNFKKLLYLFIFSLTLIFVNACTTTPCTHVDEDNNKVCDLCYLVLEQKNPECTTHSDEDNDLTCDVCGAELEAPHKHVYVDGKCECGDKDPNYVAPHEHVYVDGKCECGADDPDYVIDEEDTSEEGYVIKVKTGVPYILKLEHKGLGRDLFATGNMDGYYYETTSKLSESIVIYLEATNGGYYVYHLKNDTKIYLDIVPSGTHINVVYVNTPGDPWKFDETVNTLTNPVNGTDYMLGTVRENTHHGSLVTWVRSFN